MASTFSLAPQPKWYFFTATGKPADGGFMITRSSLDRTTPKFIFSDQFGLFPYDNPMVLDASGGTRCPMYWEFNGVDLYYLLVTDKFGSVICEVEPFPIIGGGGVTPITANIDIENHLINGQFLFIDAVNEADSLITPVPEGIIHIAPGGGYFKDTIGEYVREIPLGNSLKAGWCFSKSGGAGATDSIQFIDVTNIGTGLPTNPSANATRFFRYQFSAAGDPLTQAALLNVVPNVELFSGEILTVSFETRDNVGANGVFQVRQTFGTGGTPSADIVTSHTFTFSNGGFARQSFQFTVPSVVGKSKGTDLNDAVVFTWNFPLNTIGTFEVDNFQVQRGTFGVTPYIEQTYAQDQFKVLIDLIQYGNMLFKTGELKWMSVAVNSSGNPVDIPGWIPIANTNSITFIGNQGSPAINAGIQYKNLYRKWWDCFPQSECNVATGRGANSLSDFNAGKTMSAPLHIINTVLAGAGDGAFINAPFGLSEGFRGFPIQNAQSGGSFSTIQTNATGNNNMQPTFYLWLYVKL